MRKITLRDIANESGVSVTAVSLAMRGSRRISQDKTKEIQEIAERLGYTRDPMLSALCAYRDNIRPKNKSVNINFLQFGKESQSMLNQGTEAEEFWKGALQETTRLGYSLSSLNYQGAGLILLEHTLNQNYGEWEAAHNHYQRKFVGRSFYIPSLTFNSEAGCNADLLDKWIKQWNPQVIVSAFSGIYQLLQDLGYGIRAKR